MRTIQRIRKHTPRLLLTLTVFMALSLSMFVPIVGADASYDAPTIETWLEDAVTGTEVTITTAPSVTLDTTNHRMIVQDLAFAVRGVTIGLEDLRLTFDGTKIVQVAATLDVLGKLPKFWCSVELQHITAEGKLQVADVADIKVADFTPSLSPDDIATIVDVLNQILDSSELSVTSPGGDLEGIDVVGGQLVATWTIGPSNHDATEIEGKLDGMVNTLATKATSFMQDSEGTGWTVGVSITADISLDVVAEVEVFGITATIDAKLEFDTLAVSVTDAAVTLGTGDTKATTFSLEGDIGCTGGVPSIALTALSVGDDYPGFQGFIADVEAALLDAFSQAADAVVSSTGLTWTFCPASIAIVGDNVVLSSGTTGLIEGDANGDGAVNVGDAVAVLRYTVNLFEMNADQLKSADTTDDGNVNVGDAVHILQFTVDPDRTHNVLAKPLWETPADDDMIDPLTL